MQRLEAYLQLLFYTSSHRSKLNLSCRIFGTISNLNMPVWRNGRRGRLKIYSGQPGAGSSPAIGNLGGLLSPLIFPHQWAIGPLDSLIHVLEE